MNKKLIALAVAAALAAPAAMAQVTVYGKVHMDILSNDDDNGVTADAGDNFTVNSNASRLGIKGSEDLGNGLKAIFKYETTYSGLDNTDANNDGVDDNTTFGAARNSYIGLAGDFGTLLVGRHDTPAKSAFYAAGNDHLGDSIIDLNRMGFTERRVSNAIAYMSPNWSGFMFAAAVVPGEQSGASDALDENGLADSYSLGVMYKGHGLKAGLGYERIADTTGALNNEETSTLNAVASYTISGLTVGAQYAKHDDVGNVNGNETTVWALAGKYAFGNNAIIANYGNQDVEVGNLSNDTDYVGVAFQHSLSKRTSAYIAVNYVDDGNNDGTNVGVGMIHDF